MPRYFRYFLIVTALLAVGLLAACGSDDGDGDDNGSGDNAAEQPVDGDDDGDDVSADEVADELREFAEQFGAREFKIVYELSGGDDLGFGGQMTMYFKPPDGFRTDISSELGEIISITKDGTTYSCFSDGDEGRCLESPGTDDFSDAFAFTNPDDLIDSSNLPFDGGNVTRSSREIAGLDATCYSAEGADLGEICFSDDGALLAVLDESGEFGLEAIEVSDSVPDDAFDLPYDVVDLSDFIP